MNMLAIQQKENALPEPPLLGLTLVLLVLGIFLFPQQIQAQERVLELTLNEAGVVTLNGQTPGTLIHLNKGDRVVVRVKNNTAFQHNIRWHGIYQISSQHKDSAAGVTKRFYSIQKAIGAGKAVTHRWEVKKAGTFWYHYHINGTKYAGTQEAREAVMAVTKQSTRLEKVSVQGEV